MKLLNSLLYTVVGAAANMSTTTSGDNEIENTERSGAEEVVIKALQSFPKIESRYDQCISAAGPSIIIITEPIVKGFVDLKNRGVKIRILTDITKDNLEYCKKLIPIVSEIRHLDGVKGNFAVTERVCSYCSYKTCKSIDTTSS